MRQVNILHVSDVHFGPHHRCRPEDQSHPDRGYRDLFKLISSDLESETFATQSWKGTEKHPVPLLVVATGDLTETAAYDQFAGAGAFLRAFEGRSLLGSTLSRRDVFVVPGNHDVKYDAPSEPEHYQQYLAFYNELYDGVRPPVLPHKNRELTQIHVLRDKGVIVAELSTVDYVRKVPGPGTDAVRRRDRGRVHRAVDQAARVICDHAAVVGPDLSPGVAGRGRGTQVEVAELTIKVATLPAALGALQGRVLGPKAEKLPSPEEELKASASDEEDAGARRFAALQRRGERAALHETVRRRPSSIR